MVQTKEQIIETLDQAGIKYDLIEHPPAYTIEDIDRFGFDRKDQVAKNLFLREDGKKRYFLVVLDKHKTADLKQLRSLFKSRRLSFGSEQDLSDLLGLEKGSVTPLGILNDEPNRVEVMLDQDLTGWQRIGVHPGVNTATVFMQLKDLEAVIRSSGNKVEYIDLNSVEN